MPAVKSPNVMPVFRRQEVKHGDLLSLINKELELALNNLRTGKVAEAERIVQRVNNNLIVKLNFDKIRPFHP